MPVLIVEPTTKGTMKSKAYSPLIGLASLAGVPQASGQGAPFLGSRVALFMRPVAGGNESLGRE